jgi:hypothetical protein
MISMKELNPHEYPTNKFIDANLKTLFDRINELRGIWGKPMIVTSGLRSEEQQMGLVASGKSTAKVSAHCSGNAVDIYDEDGSFHSWCKENTDTLARIGFWMEERQGPWQHFQTYSPMSGKRWFFP